MDSIYKIVLADGHEIPNLRLNGNNFVSDVPVESDIFAGNLAPVTIYKDEVPEVHEHMDLVQCVNTGSEYLFILRDLTQKEIDDMQIRADIDFLAMMNDIEL